jgi:ankyrin repeat protein
MATACPFGDALLTRLLLEHGADATAQDEEKRTPMHWLSSHRGDVEVARLLLEHGADPTAAEDIHKQTPLDVASKTNMGVARFLREHAANASVQENSVSQEASANEHRGDIQLPLEDGAE